VIYERLEAAGLAVSVVRDDAATTASADGKVLVAISESVESARVGAKFAGVSTPAFVAEPSVFDDMGMSGLAWNTDYGDAAGQTAISIVDPAHPLAAGLNGLVTVTNAPDKYIWGRPAATARVLATLSGAAARAAIFGYEVGARMVGRDAPGRRVGWFAGRDVAAKLNAQGLRLLDAAIRWAIAPRAMLVVGAVPLTTSDRSLFDRLLGLGLAPAVGTPAQLAQSGATGAAIVTVSESVSSVDVGTRLTALAKPVVSLEPSLFDDLKMTGPTWLRDYGDTQGATQLNVLASTNTLAAKKSGVVTVTDVPGKYVWGAPATTAIKVATIVNRPEQAGIFAYETGTTMVGATAPARRVGFFAGENTPAGFTQAGWELFDAAIRWALGMSDDITPIAECVIEKTDGGFDAVFGYRTSLATGFVDMPIGDRNRFEAPGSVFRGQPTRLQPGRHEAAFKVPLTSGAVVWQLGERFATATALLPTCQSACVAHLQPGGPAQQSGLLPGAAPPVSAEESALIRDSFSWADTAPVTESAADGTPLLYYGAVYVSSPETMTALDAMRVHYDQQPLFDEEMTPLLDSQGRASYEFDGRGQFVYALIPGALWNALRAAALDPVEPVEIVRAFQLRPIPAPTAQIRCGLRPVAECVSPLQGGGWQAVFGYENPSGGTVTVPRGAENTLSASLVKGALPETFATGAQLSRLSIRFESGGQASWTLNGQTVAATEQSPRCTSEQLARVGVGPYSPFARVAPTPGCRHRTPAETAFPDSVLPPAARANTCFSVSYDYMGTFGFTWRGVGDLDTDVKGLAADALLEDDPLAQSAALPAKVNPLQSESDGVSLKQQALFGKILRRVVKAVAKVGKGVVDGVRVVVSQAARLVLQSRTVSIEVVPFNTDPYFRDEPIVRAWGTAAGQPIPLRGIGVRAVKMPFLFKASLNTQSRATVRVLNNVGATLCFTLSNSASEVVSGLEGLFLPKEVCVGPARPLPPGFSSGRIPGTAPPNEGLYRVAVKHGYMNAMAQFIDGADYMSQVAGFSMKRAEVMVGTTADLIGRINTTRAFTPCFAFSWLSDVDAFMQALGVVVANKAADPLDSFTVTAARKAGEVTSKALGSLQDSVVRLGALSTELAGSPLQAAAVSALNLTTVARDAAFAAERGARAAAQAAVDAQVAHELAARLELENSPLVDAAKTKLDEAVRALKPASEASKVLIDAATSAAEAAATATANLLAAGGDLIGAATVTALRSSMDVTRAALSTAVETTVRIVGHASAWLLRAGGLILGNALGSTLGQLFEFLAAADIILPVKTQRSCLNVPAPPPGTTADMCPGGFSLPDPHFRRAVESRRVPSHEYGHFILCNLLERADALKFRLAYNEAAAHGILDQSVDDEDVVVNESFADLVTGQLSGAAGYWDPPSAIPGTPDFSISTRFPAHCPAALTDTCWEDNVGSARQLFTPNPDDSFGNQVAVISSTIHDAFDGNRAPLTNVPTNANPWRLDGGRIVFDALGGHNRDEVVALPGSALPKMIEAALGRGTFLRYDNVFGGLSDAMSQEGFNWCQRCEVFRLHSNPADCPERWVGPRPPGLVCAWEPCDPPSFVDPDARTCNPCVPPYFFDPVTMMCLLDIE
jgi:hypothetical protein